VGFCHLLGAPSSFGPPVAAARANSFFKFLSCISRLSLASLLSSFSLAALDELIERLSAKEHKSADFHGHKFASSQAPINPPDANPQVFRSLAFVQKFHYGSPLSHDCAAFTSVVLSAENLP
jgi:hypothetical protein